MAKEKREPRRDLLFDAMAEACGHALDTLTKPEAIAIGSSVAAIRLLPDVTPELIHQKAAIYQDLHPDWDLTPRALVKYWSALQPSTSRTNPRFKDVCRVATERLSSVGDLAKDRNFNDSTRPVLDARSVETARGLTLELADHSQTSEDWG